MKKLGLMMIAALLCLSGCGNNEKVTKSCKIQENGMSEVMTITSSGKKVTTTESVLTVSYEDNQITTEEDKELLRTMIVGNFGDVKGISVEDISTETDLVVKVTIDYEKADMDMLEEMGMVDSGLYIDLDATIKALESSGYTCN